MLVHDPKKGERHPGAVVGNDHQRCDINHNERDESRIATRGRDLEHRPDDEDVGRNGGVNIPMARFTVMMIPGRGNGSMSSNTAILPNAGIQRFDPVDNRV
jgi:hypothetical protein